MTTKRLTKSDAVLLAFHNLAADMESDGHTVTGVPPLGDLLCPVDQGSLTSLTAVSPGVSVSLTRQRVFRHAQMRQPRETSCNDDEPGRGRTPSISTGRASDH
jgi:hypothetical protein